MIKNDKREARRESSEAGIALLSALVFIATTTILIAEFTTTTNLDSVAAANARDSVRAHFLNRAGANLGLMLIKIQTEVIDRNASQFPILEGQQIGDYAGQFMGVFGGSHEELMDRAKTAGTFGQAMVDTLGTSPGGSFEINLTHEDGKINLNCANGNQNERNNIENQLSALFYSDAYNPLFEDETNDGWRRDKREQVSALMDYIDRDQGKAIAAGNSEDYGYQSLDDPYKAKNNYIDSIGEIRQIRGVDDRFWTLFGNQFTIYGGCKVNLTAVSDPILISALIVLSARDQNDPVLRDPIRLWQLAKTVSESSGLGAVFNSTSDFANLVADPSAGSLAGLLGAGATQDDVNQIQNQEPVQGVELDQEKLDEVAEVGPKRIYKVEVQSRIERNQALGNVERRLTAIFDTQTTKQNARNPQNNRGAWLYWRED